MKHGVLLLLFSAAARAQVPVPGDPRAGEQIVRDEGCLSCHNVRGQGATIGPDLARPSARAYSPGIMAALMWNHAPAMWSAMERRGVERPLIDETRAGHLFAYFYSLRYFEQPGDAGRGRQVFAARGCAGCHDGATAPAVAMFSTWNDPIELAAAMWNHAPRMRRAAQERKMAWPGVTGQEMTDLVVYFRSQPRARGVSQSFSIGSAESGRQLFESKGCSTCHGGALALEGRVRSHSLTDFAASMWSHAPRMLQLPPDITGEEMRRLVGYLWSIQHFEPAGDARRGERVWNGKRCGACHGAGAAPELRGRRINSIAMVAALWKHGPAMLAEMRRKGFGWPRFKNTELNDLLEFVARPGSSRTR
jgi:cytochrome c2